MRLKIAQSLRNKTIVKSFSLAWRCHATVTKRSPHKKALHLKFIIKNRYDIRFRVTKIMNWFKRIKPLKCVQWTYPAGLSLQFWFMINLGACIATCSSNSRFNTLIMAVIKHRRQVWGTGWVHWSFPPRKCCEHSRVPGVECSPWVGNLSCVSVLAIFVSRPYLSESDRLGCCSSPISSVWTIWAQQKSFLPIWGKNSSNKDRYDGRQV